MLRKSEKLDDYLSLNINSFHGMPHEFPVTKKYSSSTVMVAAVFFHSIMFPFMTKYAIINFSSSAHIFIYVTLFQKRSFQRNNKFMFFSEMYNRIIS